MLTVRTRRLDLPAPAEVVYFFRSELEAGRFVRSQLYPWNPHSGTFRVLSGPVQSFEVGG